METQALISFKHTYEALQKYAELLKQRYQDKLVMEDHVASGDLLRRMQYNITINDRSIDISLNLESYWKWLEDGTKPHFPPVSAILEWIKVKPILPAQTYNGKLPTQEQLAYLIARKISEKGTEPSHDLEESRSEMDPELDMILDTALTLDINESLDNILALG